MRRVLISGSNGLVGSAAVDFFCEKGFAVVGVDNNQRGHMFGKDGSTNDEGKALVARNKRFTLIEVDIRQELAMQSVFINYGKFDLIIHAAAQPAHEYSTDHALEDFSINATGTMIKLESYRQFSPSATFIHVSSSKVYGDSVNELPLIEQETRFDLPRTHSRWEGMDEEDMRLDGNLHSLFGASKACGDIMAKEYGTYFNLPIAIFRPVCITGKAHKGVSLHGYLAYLVKCIATGQQYTINGYNGKQVRDNIHASDLVRAFWEVFVNGVKENGQAYNIGGGRASNNSILEAITQAEKLLNKKANTVYSDIIRRGDHKHCIYSSSKFRRDYPDWKLQYDNDAIMKELCDVYK